jgi:excisionase family DNA binding protein
MPRLAASRTGEPITPREEEVLEIAGYARTLEDSGLLYEMPAPVARAFRLLLSELAQGHGVAIVRYGRELSTQQAADLLGVSRPFLTRMIDRGELPASKVGTHRRVALDDVLRYREERGEKRRSILRDMVAEGQRLGLEL